jgi:hypothetical protein
MPWGICWVTTIVPTMGLWGMMGFLSVVARSENRDVLASLRAVFRR